jgi:hypothetical protein
MPFRVTTIPLKQRNGPWRETREEAVADAIAMELAWTDEVRPGVVFWHPLAEIEEED